MSELGRQAAESGALMVALLVHGIVIGIGIQLGFALMRYWRSKRGKR